MGNLSGGHGITHEYSKIGALWVARAAGADHTTTFTGQTAFDATTPFLLLRKTETSLSKRLVPQSMILTPSGTAPGGKVKIAIFKDLTDRLSGATGTALGYYRPGVEEAVATTP